MNSFIEKGEKTSADYFTGTAWLNILVPQDETGSYSIGNVLFEPGCRNNWHTHPAGQILLITDGKGYYQEKGKPGKAWATDVNTGESVAAESATYVEGGEIQYCTHGNQPVTHEPNGVSVREYDRCLPTLAAFKTPQEAEVYQQQHGGRVLSYTEALDSVRKQ